MPLSYPSYTDPDNRISGGEFDVVGFPTTVFLDARGEVAYARAGGYRSEDDLAEDISRHTR